MRTELLRLDAAVERDRAIHAWMKAHAGELGAVARRWFAVMRKCADEVRERGTRTPNGLGAAGFRRDHVRITAFVVQIRERRCASFTIGKMLRDV